MDFYRAARKRAGSKEHGFLWGGQVGFCGLKTIYARYIILYKSYIYTAGLHWFCKFWELILTNRFFLCLFTRRVAHQACIWGFG